jgi:hypothetical protein
MAIARPDKADAESMIRAQYSGVRFTEKLGNLDAVDA